MDTPTSGSVTPCCFGQRQIDPRWDHQQMLTDGPSAAASNTGTGRAEGPPAYSQKFPNSQHPRRPTPDNSRSALNSPKNTIITSRTTRTTTKKKVPNFRTRVSIYSGSGGKKVTLAHFRLCKPAISRRARVDILLVFDEFVLLRAPPLTARISALSISRGDALPKGAPYATSPGLFSEER